MAGLPCSVCQEEAVVIPNAVIVTDDAGNTIYRRFRTCVNPDCEVYLIRRETFEVFAPLLPDSVIFPAKMANLRQMVRLGRLPERSAPFPMHLVTKETLKNHTSIDRSEALILAYARTKEFFYITDIQEEFGLFTHQRALSCIRKLESLGLIGKSSVHRAYAAVPAHLIPDRVYLPPELQRSAS